MVRLSYSALREQAPGSALGRSLELELQHRNAPQPDSARRVQPSGLETEDAISARGGYNKGTIAQILGLGDTVRTQNPKLQQTTGKNPRWYIRPYVERLDASGTLYRVKERIYLGSVAELTKRQALTKRAEAMAKINRTQYVALAQMSFDAFLDQYLSEHVRKPGVFSASTQDKYENHIKNHIRPAFGALRMAEVTTQRIDVFLAEKAQAGLSWATRTDLRNILSAIFTQARRWGLWKEANPAQDATVGRRRAVREKRKLTVEQTRRLLAALPADVQRICQVALFCALRISEVLGLMWKHVDFERGLLLVRQRFYRGDLDMVKSERSQRDVPMGRLTEDLRRLYPGPGHEDEFVFSVHTERGEHICRDDRDINRHFLRPAAQALGIYYPGFGFHAFRREAITALARETDPLQAMRIAGHTKLDTTMLYELDDHEVQAQAVERMQARVLGGDGGPEVWSKLIAELAPANGPEWATGATGELCKSLISWWARGDSNARPLPCQGCQGQSVSSTGTENKDLSDPLKGPKSGQSDIDWARIGQIFFAFLGRAEHSADASGSLVSTSTPCELVTALLRLLRLLLQPGNSSKS